MIRLALTVALAMSLLTVGACDHEHGEETHIHDDGAPQAEMTANDAGGEAPEAHDAGGDHDHGDGSHSHDEPATDAFYGEEAKSAADALPSKEDADHGTGEGTHMHESHDAVHDDEHHHDDETPHDHDH